MIFLTLGTTFRVGQRIRTRNMFGETDSGKVEWGHVEKAAQGEGGCHLTMK